MMGQKMSPEQMEFEIIRLSKNHKIVEIEKITGKHRRTIERYLEKAKKDGKISKSKVSLSDEEKIKRDYEKSSKHELYEKYRPVKNWIDKRKAEAKGEKSKLKRVNKQLGNLKVVCDTTRLNPHVILSSGEDGSSYGGLESVMSAFSMAMVEQRVVYQTKQKQPDPENIEGPFREHLMAARSFAVYNGVSLPKFPKDHILSGKKVGFGQYAHIKMKSEQINSCVDYLIEKFGKDSFEVASFVFYYVTGARNESLYTAKTATFEISDNGWIVGRVYEKKTKATWKKYIPDDNPHYEIIERWIEKRRKEHKVYLFSENGKVQAQFIVELRDAFKEAYKEIGIAEEYFFEHAIHCLRHISAHYWLGRTKLNHVAVAKIVGWKDVQTLIQCYGEITDEQIFDIAMIGAVA